MNRKTAFYPLSGALSVAGLHYLAPHTLVFYLPVFAFACVVRLTGLARVRLVDQEESVHETVPVVRLDGARPRVALTGAHLHAANAARFDRRHRCA